MFERLDNIVKKSEEIKLELTKPEVLSDYNKLKELSKEQSDLNEIVDVYNIYKEKEKNYAHINNSCHDIAKERTGISNFWLKIGDAFR